MKLHGISLNASTTFQDLEPVSHQQQLTPTAKTMRISNTGAFKSGITVAIPKVLVINIFKGQQNKATPKEKVKNVGEPDFLKKGKISAITILNVDEIKRTNCISL